MFWLKSLPPSRPPAPFFLCLCVSLSLSLSLFLRLALLTDYYLCVFLSFLQAHPPGCLSTIQSTWNTGANQRKTNMTSLHSIEYSINKKRQPSNSINAMIQTPSGQRTSKRYNASKTWLHFYLCFLCTSSLIRGRGLFRLRSRS